MTDKPEETGKAGAKKLPFIYRSILNFWLVFILPTSLMVMVVTHLYLDRTIQWELLRGFSPWISCLLFQIIFGFLMYVWKYIPAIKRYKKIPNDTMDCPEDMRF